MRNLAGQLVRGLARLAAIAVAVAGPGAYAQTLPPGFQIETVIEGLESPTVVQFAPDGRVFVGEKGGLVKVYDSLDDATPDVLIDLRENVHDFWDRGLMGLAVDPEFPVRPYVYVLYTYNADPAQAEGDIPLWPDGCPDPPGATQDGCVANGRLSRIEIGDGNAMVGAEHVLVENRWCNQFPSHTVGTLQFDTHGGLLAGAGDGSNINIADYGQNGGSSGSPTPANPCGDPPGGRGVALTPPTAEGGALRAQDLRTPGDPVSYDGAIIRIDPDTGLALPTNPLVGGDPEDDRVIAYGLRNPFRFAVRPGEHDVWVGDVGWGTWEEINRIADVEDEVVENFGWPCYEGPARQPTFDELELALCEDLYADAANPATMPYFAYEHGVNVDPDPEPFRCTREGSSSIVGLAFADGTAYPSEYDGALFFSDFSRACIFVMFPGDGGLPDPGTRKTFAESVPTVQLAVGPDGLLYYPDLFAGTISRIDYFDTNVQPQAVIGASTTSGLLPLTVDFDGSQSTDPDSGGALEYAWDLDGDGDFDDSTDVAPQHTYTAAAVITVGLRVTDSGGAAGVDQRVVVAGNRPPTAFMFAPNPALTWRVGETVAFSGQGNDPDQGVLPASGLHWTITLYHCPAGPDDCHAHPVAEFDGVSSGSVNAPDHEWYSYLEVELTVRDSGFGNGTGMLSATSIRTVEPRPTAIHFESEPPGLTLVVDGSAEATPFSRQAISGSVHSIAAPTPQDNAIFFYWSDGGERSHELLVGDDPTTLRAVFAEQCAGPACLPILRVASTPTAFAPFPTIGEAVDAVTANGSRIEVLPSPAPYLENVVIPGDSGITIRGLDDGSGLPVIVDGGDGAAIDVALASPLNRNVVTLENLTIQGEVGIRATSFTALRDLTFGPISDTAVRLEGRFHTLDRLRFQPAVLHGIDLDASASLLLTRSTFDALSGTAVFAGGAAEIINTVIAGAENGVVIEPSGRLDLRHSTLVDSAGFGVSDQGSDEVSVAYSVVWGNQTADLDGIDCSDVLVSDVGVPDCSGGGSNLSLDPQILPGGRPSVTSPAVDHGPPIAAVAEAPCTDLEGGARFRDHDGDGLANLDLGAFELNNSASRPDEVTGLAFPDPDTLVWSPVAGTVEYHVYRGPFADFGALSMGSCRDDLDLDRTDTLLEDTEIPSSEAGFFYLITAENATGAASTAGLTECSERSVGSVCLP